MLRATLRAKARATYVVMQELRAGADEQAKVLQDGIFDVFERRNRVVGPSAMALKDCGRILATLFRQDGVPYKRSPHERLSADHRIESGAGDGNPHGRCFRS